jgi:16S rRNA A1518/A1519 N6-dimethyltransferase RsmA/KsgA/DIM1 with predicted DNA glycosylase/AP lyase activity
LEVAERIVAKPSTKQYGIPSVVFQLYAAPKINFKIPPSVFYPKPNVDSALLTLGEAELYCTVLRCLVLCYCLMFADQAGDMMRNGKRGSKDSESYQ